MAAVRELAGGKILARTDGHVGTLIFNQPEKRNAMSVEMWDGVAQILDEWEADGAIGCVVMAGTGDKAFVSGADISQFEKLRSDADARAKYNHIIETGFQKIRDFPKPTIAQIRGYALGGGLAIAMMADLRITSETGVFGIPAARMSIAYGLEGIRNLVSLVGPARARMILYSAERLDAREALRIGLVNEVWADDKLEGRVSEIAAKIASNAPLSVRYSKFAITQLGHDPDKRDLAKLAKLKDECGMSADFVEGRRAFMEKRQPKFIGK
jgi:enoyl-CoA hydratase